MVRAAPCPWAASLPQQSRVSGPQAGTQLWCPGGQQAWAASRAQLCVWTRGCARETCGVLCPCPPSPSPGAGALSVGGACVAFAVSGAWAAALPPGCCERDSHPRCRACGTGPGRATGWGCALREAAVSTWAHVGQPLPLLLGGDLGAERLRRGRCADPVGSACGQASRPLAARAAAGVRGCPPGPRGVHLSSRQAPCQPPSVVCWAVLAPSAHLKSDCVFSRSVARDLSGLWMRVLSDTCFAVCSPSKSSKILLHCDLVFFL